ncbi:MAG: PadR family transcriptional regulator [Mobilicoccus sp.]|nr:PadR family transcriptional regulator [Mobilicoccus sp.]
MTEQPWPSDWLRGVLQVAVLRILAEGPTHGYAIATALEESGFGVVKGGTLYPLLSRLEAAGFVTTRWEQGESGPGRKYLELTGDGRLEMQHRTARWVEFAETTARFMRADTVRA